MARIDIAAALAARLAGSADPERLQLSFGLACAERVRHLLEDEAVRSGLDLLASWIAGRTDRQTLAEGAAQVATQANRHPGSRSLDGVGHAAVSASYAVANAMAGRAAPAADYAAYAVVYGGGGHGAVADPESWAPEQSWQLTCLDHIDRSIGRRADPT